MLSELIVPVMDQAGGDVVVLRWLKREGELVQVGEALCELETAKANVEITAETAGVLRRILIKEGTAIPARTVLALIGSANDLLPTIDPYYRVAGRTATLAPTPAPAPIPVAPPPLSADRAGIIVSPRAKKLAADHQIDLASLSGSGPNGRIVEEDVQRAINAR